MLQIIISKNIMLLSLKIIFFSADPDGILPNTVFYLGLHCLSKYRFPAGLKIS